MRPLRAMVPNDLGHAVIRTERFNRRPDRIGLAGGIHPGSRIVVADRREDEPRREDRSPDRSVEAEIPGATKEAHAMGSPYRILIVEDEPSLRLVFRTALQSDEYLLTTAADGETALSFLEQDPADLVLLDLRMPGMDGLEVLRRLREEGNEVPVVIITAHDSVPNVVQAMRLGAIDFVSKPLTPETLRRVVAEVLARHAQGEPRPARAAGAGRPPDALSSAKRALNHRLFQRARGLLLMAIAENPDSPEPHYLMGVLHELQHEPKAASRAYQDALRVDPDYEPARLHRMKFDTGKRA
jgi:CheY-like chemotaxis protein